MSKPLGIVLAGGQATRMGGGDKGLLPLGDHTLLDEVLTRLAPQVGPIALNANGDPSRFHMLGLPVLPDTIGGFAGPLVGVLAGLDWAAEQGASHVVSAAADTPFFPRDLVARLEDAARTAGVDMALAATRDPVKGAMRQPTFGLWPTRLRNDLRDALEGGLRKVVLWSDKHHAATAVFDPDPFDPFFNVNTQDDLIHAQNLLREAP